MPNETELAQLEQDKGEGDELVKNLIVDDENIKKSLQIELARKRHWREKFEKEKTERERLENELKKVDLTTADKLKQEKENKTSDDIESVLRLRSQGKSDEDILTLRSYARKLGITIEEVEKDPLISAGIEAKRNKGKAEESTPAPSFGTISVKGKSYKDMTPKERKENMGEVVNQILKRGKSGYQ